MELDLLNIVLVVTAVLTFLTALIGFIMALKKIEQVHLSLNSRLDQWMKTLGEAEHAKGKLEGKKEAQ